MSESMGMDMDGSGSVVPPGESGSTLKSVHDVVMSNVEEAMVDHYYKAIITTPLKIQVQKLDAAAKGISKKRKSDLGWDVYCVEDEEWNFDSIEGPPRYTLKPNTSHTFKTGVPIAKDSDHGFLFRDRSSIGGKDITVLAGVIEGTYRGEWGIHLINLSDKSHTFFEGDRVAQAIVIKIIDAETEDVQVLPDSDRGDKGWGSSGA